MSTTMSTKMNEERARSFDPPGPGVWQLDATHWSRPLTRYAQEFYGPCFEAGQSKWIRRYGLPLETIAARVVHGYLYIQPMPLAGPPGAKPPPAFVLKLLAYLLPAFRRCRKIADAAMQARQWRVDARHWDETVWPALRSRYEALQAVELSPLDDAALLEHLHRATEAMKDSLVAHFDTNAATMIPTGLLLAALSDTPLDPTEILAAIDAQAPTVKEDARHLATLRDLVDAHDPDCLDAEPEGVIASLRSRDDEVGRAASAWLDRVASRQVWAGDLYLPTGGELPQLLLEQIRQPDGAPRAESHDDAAAGLRERLPESLRPVFDELLGEAQATAHLRDERCAVNDAWAGGLVRLALLEVGRRLERRSLVTTATDAVHLRRAELESLLLDGSGPSRVEIESWGAAQARTTDEAPVSLGGDLLPPPPLSAVPGALGKMAVGMFEYVAQMEGDLAHYDDDRLRGTPASEGEYIGIARIVQGPEDFPKVLPGEVLVARSTMPSYNGALAVAGAVVTDRGGALSHAAIVSRELGIPAVVGTINATKVIRDGTRVRVDGRAGQVEVLA